MNAGYIKGMKRVARYEAEFQARQKQKKEEPPRTQGGSTSGAGERARGT